MPSKIDSLAFTYAPTSLDGPSALRLFSTSGGSLLTEHFLPSALASAGTSNSFLSRALNTDANASLAGTTRTLGSLGGAIWSLAASPLGRTLAIGCEDGYVRMVDISDGKFEHLTASQRRGPDGRVQGQVSRMGRITSRVLSLAWGPLKRVSTSSSKQQSEEDSSDDDSDEDDADLWEDSFLLGGCADSAARVWDVVSGRVQDKLTVAKVRGEQTIVWSCAVLRDGTPVLGDSLGRVTFYDARTRVPLPAASFKAHGADVLTLAVGPDGKALYSAGVDQKVAEYALVGGAGGVQKWVNTAARRLHAHDIRALALDPPFDIRRSDAAPTRLPILASGGTDYTLVLTPASPPSAVQHRAHAAPGSRKAGKFAPAPPKDLANPISSNPLTSFADTTQRRLPFVPGSTRGGAASNVAQLCAAKGWIVCRRERSVGIWAIKPQAEREEEGLSDEDSVEDGWNKLLEMELKVRSGMNLFSACIHL